MADERSPGAGSEGRLSRQDQELFDDRVLPHLDAAYNLARYLLRNADEADDAVQDSFVRAIRHFGGFRGPDGRAWLLRIVRNTCFTRLRRRRAAGEAVEFDEEEHTASGAASGPELDLARTIAGETLNQALGALATEFREALVLRELEGLSYKEIAHVTEVPIGTVMSRLARARQQLSLALGAAQKEED